MISFGHIIIAIAPVTFFSVANTDAELDLSTPESALRSVRRAVQEKDARAIAAATYIAGEKMQQTERTQPLIDESDPQFMEFTKAILSGLIVRQVDERVPIGVSLDISGTDAPFDRGARVLCTLVSDRDLLGDHRLTNVVALYFVHRDGQWRWYNSPYDSWHSWTYDRSTPESARRSVRVAVEAEDVQGVYEMIDPELLPGVSLGEFKRLALERLAENTNWAARKKASREAAKAEGRFVPKQPERPYVPGCMSGGGFGLEVEWLDEPDRRAARVWCLGPDKHRHPELAQWELFVQVGESWFWRPKPEYTVWPVIRREPQSQPASP